MLIPMLQEIEHFVGIDQDACALEIAQQRLQQFEGSGVKLHYIHSNFRCVYYLLSYSEAVFTGFTVLLLRELLLAAGFQLFHCNAGPSTSTSARLYSNEPFHMDLTVF